jgi:hypothetical protein
VEDAIQTTLARSFGFVWAKEIRLSKETDKPDAVKMSLKQQVKAADSKLSQSTKNNKKEGGGGGFSADGAKRMPAVLVSWLVCRSDRKYLPAK